MAKMAKKAAKIPKAYELLGSEPDWDDQHDLTDAELNMRFANALNWYNYNYVNRNAQDFLAKHVKSKKESSAISALDASSIKPTYGFVAKMAANGLEFPSTLERYKTKLDKYISELIVEGSKVLDTKKAKQIAKSSAPVVSIQERTRIAASEHIGYIEGEIDDFIEAGCKGKFNTYDYLQKAEIKGGYMKYFIEHFQPIHEEFQEALRGEDEDLVEAYSYLSKPRKRKLIAFLANILNDCREWQKQSRGKRKARKRKVKTPKDLVKSLNFKKSDEDFGIESVKPSDIIGSSQVWVFDTKTRFMHKYVSDIGMSVKGSTLKEFDADQSFKKKIRESYCEQVLDDVVNGGKVKLRKSIANIAAKEVPVTGRIGKEMVIVRIVK
tara:strand:- start:2937 stop:4079 length:1143 start_codon:yes stop_codon:yes gene_type:complete